MGGADFGVTASCSDAVTEHLFRRWAPAGACAGSGIFHELCAGKGTGQERASGVHELGDYLNGFVRRAGVLLDGLYER